MRLLDNNLSARMADRLEAHGWSVVHVRDLGLQTARDEVVLQAAVDDDPAHQHDRRPERARAGQQLADLLLAQLPAVGPDLAVGCIVVIGEDSIRVRSLPLG